MDDILDYIADTDLHAQPDVTESEVLSVHALWEMQYEVLLRRHSLDTKSSEFISDVSIMEWLSRERVRQVLFVASAITRNDRTNAWNRNATRGHRGMWIPG